MVLAIDTWDEPKKCAAFLKENPQYAASAVTASAGPEPGIDSNPPGDFGCQLFASPVNPVHTGGSIINCGFVDGHARPIHVKQEMAANGAPATCIGVDGQLVPIGVVIDANSPYKGSQEIYKNPISQNADGTWNFGPT